MLRTSSIRLVPAPRTDSDSASADTKSLAGDSSNNPTDSNGSSGFGLAEVQERRQRFSEGVTELASFPEEEDSYSVGSSPDTFVPVVSWGVAAAQGQRRTMEDTHIGVSGLEKHVQLSPDSTRARSFFGLFDGHGGVSAAEFARDNLLELVVSSDNFSTRPGEALNTAFLDLDERFYETVQKDKEQASGSTLLAALLCGTQLVVANAGDSRAVLCRRGRALALSQDHRPTANRERLRIQSSGGYVCTEGFLNGLLGVSRGIGDYHLDGLKRKPSASKPLEGPMTAEPEISMCSLMAEDEFIVLACDGLWDVLPSQRAIELARQYLQQHDNDPQVCAQMLVDTSLELHASDNVTVMVVCLTADVPPRREFAPKDKVRRCFSQNGLDTLKSALREV